MRKNDHNAWTYGYLEEKGLKSPAVQRGYIDTDFTGLLQAAHSEISMCGCAERNMSKCFHKYSTDADISIVEGVMGMYDGEHGTAKLAGLLNLPVILVVDAYGMAEAQER